MLGKSRNDCKRYLAKHFAITKNFKRLSRVIATRNQQQFGFALTSLEVLKLEPNLFRKQFGQTI